MLFRNKNLQIVVQSPTLYVLYVVLLSVPCCLKWEFDSFHFAKVLAFTGFVSSICIASFFYLIASIRKWMQYIITSFLAVIYFCEWFVFSHFHCRLNDKMLYLVAQTDTKECGEFLSAYMFREETFVPIIALAIVLILYLVAKKYLDRPLRMSWKMTAFATFINILSLIVLLVGVFSTRPVDQISNPTIVQLIKAYKKVSIYDVDLKQLETTSDNVDGNFVQPGATHPHIIFVIGESFNPNHSPLYGYPLNTMPQMQEAYDSGNIIVFNDAVTPSAATGIAMEYFFSVAPPDNKSMRWNYPLFPMILKKAGYDVNLMDNQQARAVGDLNHDAINCQFFNSEIVSNASLSYRNDRLMSYDLDFVEAELQHRPKSTDRPVFDIFHIYGEHSPAAKRYPPNFKFPKFDYSYRTDLSEAQKETVNHYDCAVAYNDVVIERLIKSIQNTDAILIFISDHGEEVHDFRNQYGRTMETATPNIANNIYRVPMIIYTTHEYRENHQTTYQEIVKTSQTPIYTADISQMLLHIAGVASRYVVSSRDPLSQSYQSTGRRIINEETDFDQLVATGE